MPSADDFRQLADELRQIGASLVQAAGDPELTLLTGVRHFTPIFAPFRKVPPAPARV